jgi:small multidrug resistance family-3 protein
MTVTRSVVLFALAAVAEIGGAWLIWQGIREHRGWLWMGAGVIALGAYGFVATLQPDAHFGRILAAYGGVFVAGSLSMGYGARRVPARPVGRHRRAHLPRRRRRHHVRPTGLDPGCQSNGLETAGPSRALPICLENDPNETPVGTIGGHVRNLRNPSDLTP